MNQHFDYDEDSSCRELDWFYHLTGGHTHTDFLQLDLLIMLKLEKVKTGTKTIYLINKII